MKQEKPQLVRGMRDLLYDEAEKLLYIIDISREISYKYGYREAILPTIEYYSLFAEKSGYEITKRMYVFDDLSGRKIALRPELTPSVARVFINKLQVMPKPLRISYFANVFRYDEPQKARYREFWQAGFEHLGSKSALADIEVIRLAYDIFETLELGEVSLKLGSMDLIKKIFLNAGVEYGSLPYFLYLTDKRKFDDLKKELNKYEKGNEAYESISQLANLQGTAEAKISEALHLLKNEELKETVNDIKYIYDVLRLIGIKEIVLDLSFARGIEYYTGIIYEFQHKELEVSIGGGGRYDLLIEYYGGPKTPATGCALGIDRIALLLKKEFKKNLSSAMIFALDQSDSLVSKVFEIAAILRKHDFQAVIETGEKDIAQALAKASKLGYDLFIILGSKELREGKVAVRNLKERTQYEVAIDNLADFLLKFKRKD
ncbi:MAG TPA: histidine--tRNA ligase [Geobacterales bacterium]|nr:histidine--tRNA ligase [Geobacterales bacterium]